MKGGSILNTKTQTINYKNNSIGQGPLTLVREWVFVIPYFILFSNGSSCLVEFVLLHFLALWVCLFVLLWLSLLLLVAINLPARIWSCVITNYRYLGRCITTALLHQEIGDIFKEIVQISATDLLVLGALMLGCCLQYRQTLSTIKTVLGL